MVLALGTRALELLVLNANRSDRFLEAIRRIFDLDKRICVIPARRIKGRTSHTIPLSDQSIQILNRLANHKTYDFVFP